MKLTPAAKVARPPRLRSRVCEYPNSFIPVWADSSWVAGLVGTESLDFRECGGSMGSPIREWGSDPNRARQGELACDRQRSSRGDRTHGGPRETHRTRGTALRGVSG